MSILINVVALLLGSFAASAVVAVLVARWTNKTWVAALVGGSIVPTVWLVDGIMWLNNMAVDDPPPGMIMSGYIIGFPVAVVVYVAACLLALYVFAARQ